MLDRIELARQEYTARSGSKPTALRLGAAERRVLLEDLGLAVGEWVPASPEHVAGLRLVIDPRPSCFELS